MTTSLIISYLFSVAALLARRQERSVLFFLTSVCVVYLLGFRSGFSDDYYNYINSVNQLYISGDFFSSGFELFFEAVSWLSYQLNAPPNFVLFVYFLLTYYFLVRAIWFNSPFHALSFVILVCVAPMGASLNIIRQALAFALVLSAYLKFGEKNWVLYIILVIVFSLTVHASVIVLLPLGLLRLIPEKFGFWAILVISVFLFKDFSVFFINFLIDNYASTSLPYSNYFVNSEYLFTNTNNTYLLQYANMVLVLWVAYKLPVVSRNKMHSVLCKAYLFGTVMTFFFADFQAFVRIFQNYTWFGFLALPIALSYYRDYWFKCFSIFGLVVYCVILGFMSFLRLKTEFDGGSHWIFY